MANLSYIVVSGSYPFEFWGPFDEISAQKLHKTLQQEGFAAIVKLKLPLNQRESPASGNEVKQADKK